MPRTRAAENSQFLPKSIPLDKIETGIGRLQEVLVAINDFSQDGFPYRDAARTKAELQLRECVKQVFGERSQEFQTYRNYTLRTSSKAEVAQSIAAVKGLMQTLENKKLEIQGLKPPPIVAPEAEKISPATTAQITTRTKRTTGGASWKLDLGQLDQQHTLLLQRFDSLHSQHAA